MTPRQGDTVKMVNLNFPASHHPPLSPSLHFLPECFKSLSTNFSKQPTSYTRIHRPLPQFPNLAFHGMIILRIRVEIHGLASPFLLEMEEGEIQWIRTHEIER